MNATATANHSANRVNTPEDPEWWYTQSSTLLDPGVVLKCHRGQYSHSSMDLAPDSGP
jgi:hypothetical protein